MNSYIEILSCDGTALYEAQKNNMHFKTSGRLQILIAYDGMIMIKLNDFEYNVKSSQEILYDKHDPQFEMVLFLNHQSKSGKWILKINQHADQVYSCLDEKCYIRDKNMEQKHFSSEEAKGKQKKEKKKERKEKENKKEVSESNDEQDQLQIARKSITAKGVLVGASKGLGLGLALTGKVLSKGFEAVGFLASKAVKPAQKIQVSENAKANIQFAKNTSKSVLTFAASQVGNLFKFGKETATNIGQRFEKTQKGKQMQQNQTYTKAKQGTKTGVQVISNIYQGVVTAVYQMGSGISKGTGKVIGKKYGDQAGQAADDMFQGMGNVIKITRIPQDQAANAFK